MQQDKQLKEIVDLLQVLGYDISKDERKVFVDLIVESLGQVKEGKTMDEVHELINEKKTSPLYVELAYFIYEQGMPYIHNSLEQFQASRKDENSDKQLYETVFTNKENLNAYDAAFCVVKYLDEIHTPKKGVARFAKTYRNVK